MLRPLRASCSIIILASALMGCSGKGGEALDLLHQDENVVILNKSPFMLDDQLKIFSTSGKAKIAGKASTLCLVINTNYNFSHTSEMKNEFEKLTNEIQITANIVADDGRRFALGAPFQAWELHGKSGMEGEFSACMDTPKSLKRGEKISTVEISASEPYEFLGAYWWSRYSP